MSYLNVMHKYQEPLNELVKGKSIYRDVKIDVSSKYIHSDIYLKFKLYPYTTTGTLKKVVGYNKNGRTKVLVSFRDKDDFEILKHEFALVDMKVNREDNGIFFELDHKEGFNRGRYRMIKSATVETMWWPPVDWTAAEHLNLVPNDYSDLIPNP